MTKKINGWEKFELLTWKNWLMQWNKKFQLFLQIFLAVACWLLLLPLRSNFTIRNRPDRYYYEFSLLDFNLDQIQGLNFELELLYSPKNNLLDTIVENAAKSIKIPTHRGVANAAELEKTLKENKIFAGVQFDDSLANIVNYPPKITYKLRFPTDLRFSRGNWNTKRLFAKSPISLPREFESGTGAAPDYTKEGFLPLQHAIFLSYMSVMATDRNIPPIAMERYPYPEHFDDTFLSSIKIFFNYFLLIGFLYMVFCTAQQVTAEKEKKLKEVMKIMGLPNWIQWLAWFFKAFILFAVPCIVIVIIVKSKNSDGHAILYYTDWSILLVLFLVYSCAVICYCFLIASCFTRATITSIVAAVVWLCVTTIADALTKSYDNMSWGMKIFWCFWCNTAMNFALQLLVEFEVREEGLQWNNLFKTVSPDDNLTMGPIIFMMLLSSMISIAICLYIDEVFPGEFGIPRKWYFPFTKAFWCKNKGNYRYSGNIRRSTKRLMPDAFEYESHDKKVGLQAIELTKRFDDKWVVKGFTLNMYVDEITVLLGHNGAGKTTTISMLIGIIPPTSGTSVVNGIDIRKNLDAARSSFSLCPQYNILFDYMSVKHHIVFFSRLKGLKGAEVKEEVDKYLNLLNLEKKKNNLSTKLSGGMKRRLSVCCALCGKTQVVLLDEPSSGLDPAARRQLWNLLQQEKIGRTILLTTHFMDEADVLGDRVAIMCEGELKCVGTPFFLKKRYGSGYKLICSKRENCNVEEVTNLLSAYIPDIQPKSDIGTELKYELPDNYSNVFETMLRELETESERLGISGYGVSITSLEEVFLKVGAEDESVEASEKEGEENALNGRKDDIEDPKNPQFVSLTADKSERLKGCALILSQFHAMFLKHSIHTWRSIVMYLLVFSLPILFVLLSILTARNQEVVYELPAMEMSLNQYPEATVVVEEADDIEPNSFEADIINALTEIVDAYGVNYKVDNIGTDDFRDFILELGRTKQIEINTNYVAAYTFDTDQIKFWLNAQPLHAAPMTLNLLHNAIVKATIGPDASIRIVNLPVPLNAEERMYKKLYKSLGGILPFLMLIALAFVTAFPVIFLISERRSGAKLLQFIGGVKIWIFWLSQYLWDWIMFGICALLTTLFLGCFEEEGYETCGDLLRFLAILLIFALAAIPLTYVLSFVFKNPVSGFMTITMFNILLAFVAQILIWMLIILDFKKSADFLKAFFGLFPHYVLYQAMKDLYSNSVIRSQCNKKQAEGIDSEDICRVEPSCCDLKPYFGMEKPGVLQYVIKFLVVALVLLLIVFMLDYALLSRVFYFFKYKLNKFRKPPPESLDNEELDEDVAAEKKRIAAMSKKQISEQVIVLNRVTKYYCRFLAVNQISLCVKRKECFGLLGANGAGKTTTFKMMTGDIRFSSGAAYINGKSLLKDISSIRSEVGYCPQFDALLNNLSGRETMRVFCLLRGEPKHRITPLLEALAKAFGFTKHLEKRVKSYSGGNKRKLSTAIAVIGNPSIIFLDEPTSGMDPVARRKFWNAISALRDSGKAFVLTSHSMEECEALCTRLAIMVNGEFKCIGSTQHLKNRFSKGLIWKIKVKEVSERKQPDQGGERKGNQLKRNIIEIKEALAEKYPQAVLQEEYQSMLTYYVPLVNVVWSEIFGFMEQNRDELNIEDYSISQTTLEEIFLDFVKQQTTDPRELRSRRQKCCC